MKLKGLMDVLLLVLVVGLMGCGGGGGGTTVTATPPAISSLRYTPVSATLNQGGGAITAVGAYDFIDTGADLAGGSVTLKVYDHNNNLVSSATTPITGITTQTSGVLSGTATINTTVAGTMTFVLFITI